MRKWQDFDLVTVVTTPMFLFSGTFFPITVYPDWLQTIVELTPLYRGVHMLRSFSTGDVGPTVLVDIAYLSVMGLVGVAITVSSTARPAAEVAPSRGRSLVLGALATVALGADADEPPLGLVRSPVDAARPGEAQVGGEGGAQGPRRSPARARGEARLPPDAQDADRAGVPVDARLDAAHEPVAAEQR